MSKKSLGLDGAHDYAAGMRANAEKLMPNVMDVNHMARGGKTHGKPAMKHRPIPPQMGMNTIPSETSDVPPPQMPMLPAQAGAAPGDVTGGMKRGGKTKHHYKKGGSIAKAVHKHEKHDHPGEPLTPLKKGGKAHHHYAHGGKVHHDKGKSLNSQSKSKAGGFDPEEHGTKGHGEHGHKKDVAYERKGGKPHYAMGGAVGAIRKGGATKDGMPTDPAKHPPEPSSSTPRVKFKNSASKGGN